MAMPKPNAYDDAEDDYSYDATGDWGPLATQGLEDYSAYVADEWNQKWTVDDPVEAGELECMAFVVTTLGEDCLKDPDICANMIQDGSAAFIAKGGKGKGDGTGKGGKGKGDGKGKGGGKGGGKGNGGRFQRQAAWQ